MFEKSLQGKSLRRLARLSCSLAFLIEGYQAGILGGVQDTKAYRDALGNPTGKYIIPMIASSYTLAAMVMSALVVIVGMPLGRRNSILLGTVLIFFGGIIQAASFSVAQIIFARILCGLGIALITCNVPMYMSEMSIHASERGPEVAINCSSLLGGVALSYWVDFGFTRLSTQISWRMPIAIQSLFALVSGVAMFFCPDTPRWYYAKGRNAEGDKTLARLYGAYLPTGESQDQSPIVEMVKAEIIQIIQIEAEQENQLSWISLIWDNTPLRVGRRIRISFIILSIQQMMGVNILVYYMTLTFSQATYGCTELSSCVSQSGVRDEGAPAVATGTIVTNIKIRFINEQGEDVYPPESGEICVSSPTIMMGYKDNPDATKEAMLEPGWYRTGGIGYLDKNGYLIIIDRIKDVIKYKGFQVSPTELEEIIGQHSGVADAAVTSAWDDKEATEIPCAFIIPKSLIFSKAREQLANEIQELVSSKVAGYKKLRGGVYFTDNLPRNPTGKLLRRELRKKAQIIARI